MEDDTEVSRPVELFLKEMENSITCILCMERFREPRSLPCLHTFCTECLEGVVRQQPEEDIFCCPTCRAEDYKPDQDQGVEKYPKAFFHSSLADTIDKFENLCLNRNARCSVCAQNSKEQPGIWFCMDCIEVLCDHCYGVHRRLLRTHDKLVSCVDIQWEDLQSMMKQRCEVCQHHGEPIRFFCQDCQQLACLSCAVVLHCKHEIVEANDVLKQHHDFLQDQSGQLMDKVQYYTLLKNNIDKTKSNYKQQAINCKNIVNKQTKKLIRKIQDSEKQVITEIHSILTEAVHELDALRGTLDGEELQIRSTVDVIKSCMEHGSPCSIISTSVKDRTVFARHMERAERHNGKVPSLNLNIQLSDESRIDKEILVKVSRTKVSDAETELKEESSMMESMSVSASPVPENETDIDMAEDNNEVADSSEEDILCATNDEEECSQHVEQNQENLCGGTSSFSEITTSSEVEKLCQINLPEWTKGPGGICCVKEGILVCEQMGPQVQMYSSSGLVDTILQNSPDTVAWDACSDAEGNMYVSDSYNHKILIFHDEEGGSVSKIINADCHGVAVHDKWLYFTEGINNKVKRVKLCDDEEQNNNLVYYQEDFITDTSDVPIKGPGFIAACKDMVAVSCNNSHTVQVYSTDGTHKFTYGGQLGSGNNELRHPWGVVFDEQSNIYVADTGNHRVIVISPAGRLIKYINIYEGGLQYPLGIAINSKGQLVVACHDPDVIATYRFH